MSDDKDTVYAKNERNAEPTEAENATEKTVHREICEKKNRKVYFPADGELVTQYFEPPNPWQDVPPTDRAQLAAEYLECCRKHNTPPIEVVLEQIRELPEAAIGGATRAPCLTLTSCSLVGSAPCDALEALLRHTQFRRVVIQHATVDDEGVEALFDMIEYYESATCLTISGPRQFGIRGWQAACRMIKRSWHLSELEVSDHPLEAAHAAALSRALATHACTLARLTLTRARLADEALLVIVAALKSNKSVTELRLGDNCLCVSDASQLASLLRINTRITLLDLSNNMIQDAGVGHIADALVEQSLASPPSSNTSPVSPQSPLGGCEARGLAVLILWNNQLTRNCAVHLTKALRACPSLRVLNIGRNCVGGACVRALAEGALLWLGLQAARLADPQAPLPLITGNKLQRLDLRDNKLGLAGLQGLLTAMQSNTVTTQIDLDDPSDWCWSGSDSESCSLSAAKRVIAEINALCRRNDAAPHTPNAHALHRKISLTCHSAATAACKSMEVEFPRSAARLRSPLPSPAGSPVPHQHSRFSVTRVTPERELSDSSAASTPSTPTRPTHSPTSRFKVVQVSEPPQIKIYTPEPSRSSSRFSVTRNYDSVYNTPLSSPSATVTTANTVDKKIKAKELFVEPNIGVNSEVSELKCEVSDVKNKVNEYNSEDYKPNEVSVQKSDSELQTEIIGQNIKSSVQKSCESVEKNEVVVQESVQKSEVSVQKSEEEVQNSCTNVISSASVIDASEIDKNNCREPNGCCQNVNISVTSNCDVVVNKNNIDSDIDSKDVSLTSSMDDNAKNDVKKVAIDIKSDIETENEIDDVTMKITDFVAKIEVQDKNINNDNDKVHFDDTVKTETQPAKVHSDQIIDVNTNKKPEHKAIKQMEAITEDLSNLIQDFKYMSTKTSRLIHDNEKINVPVTLKKYVVLKKNKSESSLDSPDLEVSRLMNKKCVVSPFCDSSSSLEISGSSMESLNMDIVRIKPIIIQESIESDTELDRRKPNQIVLSDSSVDSNTEPTPVNTDLNMSVSSNDSASPIIFSNKKIHGSLSSLEASVSSLELTKERMVTSADSGLDHSLQNPDDNTSNEGTLTNNSSLKSTSKNVSLDTLTSPKRTSSLLDVPSVKNKNLDRTRKISWVAPSSSFHAPKPDVEKTEIKLTSHLDKLLSLFQHPSSLFSRSTSEEEKRSTSNTPPRRDSSLTSAFWSWGVKEKEDKEDKTEDSSEATDSTLSERIQVSYVDESFSKKLDSKASSTETDASVSLQHSNESDEKITTDEVQNLVLRDIEDNSVDNRASDITDLNKPNDFNKNYDVVPNRDSNKNTDTDTTNNLENRIEKDTIEKDCIEKDSIELKEEIKQEAVRPRTFAAVLKASGSENSLDKQTTPDTGQPVDKLPFKVIRGIKENISPENTLISSMSNTKALAMELNERQIKNQKVSTLWEPQLETEGKAPIATIEETCDEIDNVVCDNVIDTRFPFTDEKNISTDSGVTIESVSDDSKKFDTRETLVDLGKDALSYLTLEQDFSTDQPQNTSLAQELKDAENKEKLLDLSPELIVDEAEEIPEVFSPKDIKLRTSPIIPERAKIVKSSSFENLLETIGPNKKTIAFVVPESTPRDIPERKSKLRSRSGSSPKSLPETLGKQYTFSKFDSVIKKKKKVGSLGKIARDSLLALNMTEEEIAELKRSYKITSVESLRSLESVSEDANSQSGTSYDSRCRSCLRTSQESLISLDSITEDCKCREEEKNRSDR